MSCIPCFMHTKSMYTTHKFTCLCIWCTFLVIYIVVVLSVQLLICVQHFCEYIVLWFFVFYWCIVLVLSASLSRLCNTWREYGSHRPPTRNWGFLNIWQKMNLAYLNDPHGNFNLFFMHPNSSSIMQPMDQGVTTQFTRFYLKTRLQQMLAQTNGGVNTKKCWNDCIFKNAITCWNITSPAVWHLLWPQVVKDLHY